MNKYAEMIKQGIMGRTELGWETQGGCVPDPKLSWSSEGDLGRSKDLASAYVLRHQTPTVLKFQKRVWRFG